MIPVDSWGRLGAHPHHVIALHDASRLQNPVQAPGLAYGMGRSYGDVCLNPGGVLWMTRGLDRFIAFDDRSGRLACETGVLLRDIQRLAIPRGWMLPVTPGTQLVTVGGAIANDVHGKNHHVHGAFGNHVAGIRLLRTDGRTIECSPVKSPDWFQATVGGLGLTGVMTEVELQLRRVEGPWLDTETIPFSGLEEFFHWADASEMDWEHTVSWIDCLSKGEVRGVFLRANHHGSLGPQEPARHEWAVPCALPVSLVNRLTLRPFNTAYYHLQKYRAGRGLVHYEAFLYPLDGILHWNRMYGPNGFFQYQCVVPRQTGLDAIRSMLQDIARVREGSFLAVLKTFGNRSPQGMLSFSRPGVTLALDFPNRGESTLHLFRRLDAIVREAGGCLYAAKDVRMPKDLFEAGNPRLEEFLKYRDPGISSGLSRRLMGD